MIDNKNIFLKKKILIYGLGKSGISSYEFLKNKAKLYLFDDDPKKKFKHKSKQWINNIKKISKNKFDVIIISPGIDILKCKLSKFLKKNETKFLQIWMYSTHFTKTNASPLLELMVNQPQQKYCMIFY